MLYSKKEDLLEEKENLNYIILDKRTDKKYEEKKVKINLNEI